jgi:AsmA protein
MLRRFSLALILLICLVVLISAPYLIDGRSHEFGLRGAAVYAASRDSYSLSSPIQLLSAPKIALESGTLSMPPNRTGLARSGEMLAMLITGKSARMMLDGATFSVDFTSAEATSSAFAQGGIAPLVSAFQKLQFDALAVRDSALRVRTADGAVLLLDHLNADVTAKPDGAARAAGSFVFRGETVTFDTALGTTADSGGARPISATVQSGLLNAKLDGAFMLGESPRVTSQQAEINIPNLRRAARWFGVPWRDGSGFEDVHLKGQLEWTNRTVAFQKAVVQMDGNEGSGTLSVNFAGARPALDGTLALKTFDLSKYFAKPAATGTDAQAAASDTASVLDVIRQSDNLEFALLKIIDADLRLSSDSVTLPGTSIGRSAATLSVRSGKMLADIAELEIDDGTKAGGQLRIDTNGFRPAFEVRGKLEALDVGRAAQLVFGHPTVQGHGDVTVDISAAGSDGETLLNSLNGKLCVTLDEGGLLGIDVNKLVAAVNDKESPSVWRAASAGAISVDKLDAKFILAKGTIRTESAEAQSGGRTMKAQGAIDLPRRSIDMELAIGDTPVADPVQDTGSVPDAKLVRTREVIDMRGPWSEPVVKAGTGSPAAHPG